MTEAARSDARCRASFFAAYAGAEARAASTTPASGGFWPSRGFRVRASGDGRRHFRITRAQWRQEAQAAQKEKAACAPVAIRSFGAWTARAGTENDLPQAAE